MAELFKNLASTTLNGDHDDTTTSISVVERDGIHDGDFRILIDSEIMKVTGVSGTTLPLCRHQEDTSAASHTNGTAVYHVLTAGAWTPTTRTIWRPMIPMPIDRPPVRLAASSCRPMACSLSATTAQRGRSSARSGP